MNRMYVTQKWEPCRGPVNPLKPKLVHIILKKSARTSKKTLQFTITMLNWLMPLKEMVPVYAESHTRSTQTHSY
jgi:hypothetical protein